MAFADEAGLVGVGSTPGLANGVAAKTTNIVVGAKLGIQIFHAFTYATELQHLAFTDCANVVVIGRHCMNICKILLSHLLIFMNIASTLCMCLIRIDHS